MRPISSEGSSWIFCSDVVAEKPLRVVMAEKRAVLVFEMKVRRVARVIGREMPCYQQMASNFRQLLTAFIEKEAQPREKFGHQPRLYSLTRKVGEGSEYDDDVVFAAVWLHDLGVFVGHRPENLEELRRWDNTAYAMRESARQF